MDKLLKFLKDEDGEDSIEYALIAGLIAIVVIVGATPLGAALRDYFTAISVKIEGLPTP